MIEILIEFKYRYEIISRFVLLQGPLILYYSGPYMLFSVLQKFLMSVFKSLL